MNAAPTQRATVVAPVVALAGNPNVGKSTLFNRLTGARQRVINAPRTTVEYARGTWRSQEFPGGQVELIDLPGAYDIHHGTADERVTQQVLGEEALGATPDLTVVAIDATALGRSLFLLAQAGRHGTPMLAVLTMVDVAAQRGTAIDVAAFAEATGIPVVAVDPRAGAGTDTLASEVAAALARPRALEAPADDDAALDWADAITRRLAPPATASSKRSRSDRIDRALLHPTIGIPVFLAVLWATFQLVTAVAAPLIDGVDTLWNGTFSGWLARTIPGDTWPESALIDGVLAGVGTVLSFVPLMLLAFAAFAILEDSGYLARAAFVTDKALRAIGLDGRATLPLVLGFGCNLPALAALKVLPTARQRLAAGMLIPFTSCSARLPVYLLLAAAFFPDQAGTVVFLMYVASAAVIIVAGLIAKAALLRSEPKGVTLMVLPAYQRPRLRALAASSLVRVRAFVVQAGTVIVIALAALWVLAALPAGSGGGFAQVDVEDSAYAAVSRSVTPVFAPAGFDDWRATSALVTGLVAKELVVGSFAQSYALADEDNTGIGEQLRATFDASSGGHGQAAAAAFLVFVLMYSPCIATMGEQRRQFGTRWMATSVGIGLAAAYVGAVLTFQLGRLL